MHCLLLTLTLCAALHDSPVMALTTAQTAAMVADGISTRRFVARGQRERDPIARLAIGSAPTWGRIVPVGAAVVVLQTYLAERMKTSRHEWARRVWWLPQVVSIQVHTTLAVGN